MPSESTKPLIFISYAHADEPDPPRGDEIRWLSFVMEFLRPGVKGRKYDVWIDRVMPVGTDWKPEIEARIRACDIFVLLVSTRSTSSDFILDKEVPIIRERQRNGDGVHFCPLLIDWTPDDGLELVKDKNLRPRDSKPFSSLSPSERSRQMTEVANEIAGFARAVAERKAAPAREGDLPVLLTPEIAGILEAVRGRQGVVGPATAGDMRPRPPILVDIGALPETGYERLVGRDAQLKRLDDAWGDDKTNIVSLIAEGGAGKSALVNEWLERLRAEGYRGATIVLGWSFFSQGSRERATSADEFLNWAMAKLGVEVESTSASAKGEAIAEALARRRALLMLDGVEPLQYGPGPQAGQLKDQGLRALLRRFAVAPPAAGHSLIVLTSRVAVADIQRFRDGAAPVVRVDRLTEEAGAELLRDNDVWGIEADLRSPSRDFAGHPLALTLLASYLKETQNGDARRRDHIRGLLADKDNPRHDQARRVMESYEKEWLADQPVLLAILHIVGLFDRPADDGCLRALRAKPVIAGLTDEIVDLDDSAWRRHILRLREVHLLTPADPSDPDAIDAHPLVREWFGERLRQANEAAWKAAHGRLFEHLRDTTREGERPTLAALAPLYHAVAHGCRAERQEETLRTVYLPRIHRGGYSFTALGAAGANLAAVSWFFDAPYETPSARLATPDRAWILSEASFALRAIGRLKEALPVFRACLAMTLADEPVHWLNAAIRASNLSETELILGDISAAAATAQMSVAYADKSPDAFRALYNRTSHAETLHAAGEREAAETLLVEAERRQQVWQPRNPLLYSLQGYRYCDLMLAQQKAAGALDRATKTLVIELRNNWVLNIGLDTLILGRAHLALASRRPAGASPSKASRAEARAAGEKLNEAIEILRSSGESVWIACGLIARAAFRRAVGDWEGAGRDLDESQEIAESGPMRLSLCDCAIERARLALARREAFAPLNGFVEPGPLPPVAPDAAGAARLAAEAQAQLDAARKLVAECGYHRRDEEASELDDVLSGRRRFADLPPRA